MIDGQKVIVALDGISELEALRIALSLKERVWGFKINDLLYEDLDIIGRLKKFGKVFADLKLHDIPNTIANTVGRLSLLGADLISVHAAGGVPMLQAAKANAGQSNIIAVTVLTSIKSNSASADVYELAKVALDADVDGIVCSGHELEVLERLPRMKPKLKVVPGIRPTWYTEKDDQIRTMTPSEALTAGADFLVIGRPITKSKNPGDALLRL